MGSKLTLHLQQCPSWVRPWLERSGQKVIKWIDPPAGQHPFPGLKDVQIVGRTFEDDQISNARIWLGVVGAHEWMERWRRFYDERRYVAWWEFTNEPQPMRNPEFRHRLSDFTRELVRLFRKEGLRGIGFNWSVGWPDVGHVKDFASGLRALAEAGFLLGVHEYGAPYMNVAGEGGKRWWTLRVRNTIAEMREHGIPVPGIWVGECGIDLGAWTPENPEPRPTKGWRDVKADPEWYLHDNLIWYDQELQRLEQELGVPVLGAAVFTTGAYPPWEGFDVDEGLAMRMADYIAGRR